MCLAGDEEGDRGGSWDDLESGEGLNIWEDGDVLYGMRNADGGTGLGADAFCWGPVELAVLAISL